MKILIVEDNAKMRAFIKKIIESNINNVEAIYEYDDGDEAAALYQKYHPDWVLMDIQLKTTDGLTATKVILKSDPLAKIVIVTQYDDPEYKEQANAAGAYGYVLKDNLILIPAIIKQYSEMR